MKEKLTAFFLIIRPLNFIITIASVIVAAFISSSQTFIDLNLFLAAFAAGFTASAGNIINDIFDFEIDKINQPQRVLPSQKISMEEAYLYYFVLLVISILLSFQISFTILILVVISHILLFLYSKYLKRVPLIGNIIIAVLTGLVFIYGGALVDNPLAAVIPAVFAFLINLIREIVKDMQDIVGDKKSGIFTFPSKYGINKSKVLISFLTIVLIIFTFYPFLTELYKIEFFIIVMILVNPILIYCLKKLFEDHTIKNLMKISNLLKLNMVFGLLAIFLGV